MSSTLEALTAAVADAEDRRRGDRVEQVMREALTLVELREVVDAILDGVSDACSDAYSDGVREGQELL